MEKDWLAAAQASEAALDSDEIQIDPAWKERFPALAAFMGRTTDPQGKPRQGCKLTIYADQGTWKVTLADPNTEHSLYRTITSPECAFLAIEDALTSGHPDWRPWRREQRTNGKKRY